VFDRSAPGFQEDVETASCVKWKKRKDAPIQFTQELTLPQFVFYPTEMQLQVFECDVPPAGRLWQWVPFAKEDSHKEEWDQTSEWREPFEILTSTIKVNPGELISVEDVYKCHSNKPIVHCAAQIHVGFGIWAQAMYRMKSDRFTRTAVARRLTSIEDGNQPQAD